MNENKDENRPARLVITEDTPVVESQATMSGSIISSFFSYFGETPSADAPPRVMVTPSPMVESPPIDTINHSPHPGNNVTPKVTCHFEPVSELEPYLEVTSENEQQIALEDLKKQLEEQRQFTVEARQENDSLREQIKSLTEDWAKKEKAFRQSIALLGKDMDQLVREMQKKHQKVEEALAEARQGRGRAEIRTVIAEGEAVKSTQELDAWKRTYEQEKQERQQAENTRIAQEKREAEAREAARMLLKTQERQRAADTKAVEERRAAEARKAFAATCSTGVPTLEEHYKVLDAVARNAGF